MKPGWERIFLCEGCFVIPAEKDHDGDEDLSQEKCAICQRPAVRAVLAPHDAEPHERIRRKAK